MLPPNFYIARNILLFELDRLTQYSIDRLVFYLANLAMSQYNSDIIGLTDIEIMDRIFRQYRGYIYALATSRLRAINLTNDDIEDCVSFIVVKLGERNCRKIRQFKGRSSFKTYLTAVCLNLIKDYIKSELRRRDRVDLVDEFTDDSVPVERSETARKTLLNNPEVIFLARERQNILLKAEEYVKKEIEKLPAQERLVMLYRFQERMSYREIDELLGIKNSTYLFSRALKRIRNTLEGEMGVAIRDVLEGVS